MNSSLKNKGLTLPNSGWIWSLPRYSGLAQFGIAVRSKYEPIRTKNQGSFSSGTIKNLESSPSYNYPATVMARSKKLDYYSIGQSNSDLINIGEEMRVARIVRHSKNKKLRDGQGQSDRIKTLWIVGSNGKGIIIQ
jgi:hypothetical protein|uniref:Uncharacterized protein n=1 Tax=Diphylleia rotans TaxID=190327 RepID=A0A146I686_9EUKA|nr:hypothetical protein A5449_gp51 [Diphylleia rotans]BAU71432.1 hypothetical protein [Diphylleia rotans]